MGLIDQDTETSEAEIHDLLRNERRRQVIEYMQQTVGSTTLREVAEVIAAHESNSSPPPTDVRQSVYNSLHQTHLPKLDRQGVITYDTNRKTIRLNDTARPVAAYMGVIAPFGITWSGMYRVLGTSSLCIVLASLLSVPVVSAIDPVLWTVLFLGVYLVAIGYQLWDKRWLYLNLLVS